MSLRNWPGKNLDVHTNRYYNIPFRLLMIYVGCSALFIAARKLGDAPAALRFVGRKTLIFYMAHNYAIDAVRFALGKVGVKLSGFPALAAHTLVGFCLCAALAVCVNRWLPELAGRRRVRPGA